MTRTINERKIYSSQTKNILLNVLHYSLTSNELLLYHLNTSNAPVKTIEVYTFVNSEYGIDYILIEDGSVLKAHFLVFLEESRVLFQDILQATEAGIISSQVEIQQVFTEYFTKNQSLREKSDDS